ncbi:MAG: FAD-dependent oxidoreductase [Proteobacteria bacterium]|nr:FAD-dependent oxidoreductase [Pseudomonadota bacterium]
MTNALHSPANTIAVVGTGVAGLVSAFVLNEAGFSVEVFERSGAPFSQAASRLAGGMIAPFCEGETADEIVVQLGQEAHAFWRRAVPEVIEHGTLVVAPPRDGADLARFARRTREHETLDAKGIAALEPALAGRFEKGLFFPSEAHITPRDALRVLYEKLLARGVTFHFNTEVDPASLPHAHVVDARGFYAAPALKDLRPVRGEMLVVRTPEVQLSRPVRFLHPRLPLYIVPRSNHHFMLGATMIESDWRGQMSVRTAVDLLNAAFALHPAFAEAEIIEMGADLRPAFPDNIPAVKRTGKVFHINGMYRHGYLLAPSLAQKIKAALLAGDETGAAA